MRINQTTVLETPPGDTTWALPALLQNHRILLVVGSGGVGKTTTAATLGLLAAQKGRKVLVLTIDPARRLADALGVSALRHDVQQVPPKQLADLAQARGEPLVPGGTLHAMMLDQKRAFDDLVARYARDAALKDRVLGNPIYQQISATLAGSHEYAAMSRLFELAQNSDYDLLIMDTPPTENAIDFLEAPDKVSKAVESDTLEWIMKQHLQQAGSLSLRLLGMGGAIVLRGLSRFVGSAFLSQVAEFFVEFQGVLAGFKERAKAVRALLSQKDVAFLLVCSPEPLSVDEALYFHDRLAKAALQIRGCVVNRVHRHTNAPPQNLTHLLGRRKELVGFAQEDLLELSAELVRTAQQQQQLAESDEASIRRLAQHLAPPVARHFVPLCPIPLLEEDVHDTQSLALIGRHLWPPGT